jgi:hypothetical protein
MELNPDLIVKGTEVEAEHAATYEWLQRCFKDGVLPSAHALYAHIALDHIKEHENYYARLEEAGL